MTGWPPVRPGPRHKYQRGMSNYAFLRLYGARVMRDSTRRPSRTRTSAKVERNRPCPCGSGVKAKRCCAA